MEEDFRSCFDPVSIQSIEIYTRIGGLVERVSSMRNDCLRFYSQIRICLEGLWVTRGPRSPIIVPLGGGFMFGR